KLRISNPDSVLLAEGEWLNWKRNPNTRMNINWAISDVGKTLERFGYPNTVKGGNADFIGQLNWPGSPHAFDVLGLNGNFKVDARNGQILQIQPGVGRLFSVLSLQNLPRRLTFDFRDVFSSGFTFDKVSANVKIDRGVMHSNDFILEGPTARVEMKGETDLHKETQHLFVKVTPYISDSLSLAALAGGPAVAAAAYLAQKLLKDPLNKLAVDRYEIIGTWDNPQEVKSDNRDKAATPTASPLGKQ
ncbi:MAG TPA: AsmA-like C-terminal region-containing protein, partial [Methylophilaceae bacterium]|nr:AsmA-like C-terminal region-containing protein [Methylophilaceae bacterium]